MKMSKNSKSGFGIIGLGRFGTALARSLAEGGRDVLVIDESEDNIRRVREEVQDAYVIGGLTREAMEETGIGDCETVIICISKVDVSVLTAQSILEMGVPRVISKADSLEHGMILEKIGSEVVYPEVETALRLATVLLESSAIDLMKLYDDYLISEIRIPENMRRKTVRDLQLSKFNLRLVALEFAPNRTVLDFDDGTPLKNGEIMAVVGRFADVEAFEKSVKQ
jgi:trk system potassium uptake protein TrkA